MEGYNYDELELHNYDDEGNPIVERVPTDWSRLEAKLKEVMGGSLENLARLNRLDDDPIPGWLFWDADQDITTSNEVVLNVSSGSMENLLETDNEPTPGCSFWDEDQHLNEELIKIVNLEKEKEEPKMSKWKIAMGAAFGVVVVGAVGYGIYKLFK